MSNDREWQATFRDRLPWFGAAHVGSYEGVPLSVKIRATAGCFHRDHSPSSAVGLVERDPKAASALLSGLREQVKITLGDIRRLVYALRPPVLDEFGLVAAIRDQAAQHDGAKGLRVDVTAPTHSRRCRPPSRWPRSASRLRR